MQFRVFIIFCLFHLVPSCSVFAIGNQSNSILSDTAQIDQWLQFSNQALQKNFKLAKNYADSARNLAEKMNYESRIYKAHEQIANAELAAGNSKESFENFNLAYEYYMRSKQKSKAAHMLNRMGECKRLMDDYQTALNYFQQSIKIQTELKDTNEVGSCQISIGVMYAVKGDKASAEKYFNEAIRTFQSIGNHEREHLTLLNMGGMFREFGELEKSIEYSKKAKSYFKERGNEKRMAIAMYNLAVAYFEIGDLESSKKEIAICLPIYEKLGDKLRINGTMMRLAEIELKQGRTDLALQYAQKALKGASEIGSLSTQVFLYKLISEIYVKKNDYKSALDYRIQFEGLRDSINSQSMNEKMAELEKKYQSEAQTLKLKEMSDRSKLAERDKIIANKKIKEQRNFQFFLIGFTLLILLVAGLIYNRYDIKRRNNLILEEKNSIIQKSLNEKELLLNEIHHRVKNNLQFIRSMLNLQSRFVHDKQASSILLDINNRVQTMALVHQKLYQEDNLKGVEMRSFLNSLIENLLYSFKIEKNALDLHTDIDKINLDIDVANSIGLIINELLTNSIKYALPQNGKGKLEISLRQHNEYLLLKVMDAGNGYEESEINKESGQFGIKLIHALTEKLKAEIQLYNQDGAVAEIKIPNSKV
jgi:two-component system, sensor histidine kinase PdtaS